MNDEQPPDAQPDTASLTHAADQVSGSADAIVEELARLRLELGSARTEAAEGVASERSDRRRANAKFAVAILLDIVLSVVSTVLYISQHTTSDDLKKANAQIQTSLQQNYVTAAQQKQTRLEVLCPLYQVLYVFASNPLPENASTPQQKDRLAAGLSTIEKGYGKLGCVPTPPG